MDDWLAPVTSGAALGSGAILIVLVWLAWRQGLANRALTRALAEAQATREALAAAEARLRRVQRIGRVGGFEIDLRSGVNRRDAEYMGLQGLRHAAALERHEDWVRRLHPEDRARAERRFLEAVADRVGADGVAATEYAQEYRILTPAGEVRWIAARAEIERDGEGRALRMLGAHVDITELKAAEAALRDSEARFRAVAESLPQIVWTADAAGTLDWHSARWTEYTGLPSGDLTAELDWAPPIHPEDLDRTGRAWAGSVASGEPYEVEHRIRRKDGAWRWFLSRAVPLRAEARAGEPAPGPILRWFGTATDIHDRRDAEQALRESEERFRTFAEHAPHTIYIVDAVHRRLEYLSPAFERIWGEPRAALMRDLSRWREFLHPDDQERVQALQSRFYAGAEPIEVEYRIVRQDGEVRHLRDTAVPILDPQGRVVRAIGIAHDVTAARQAETAMRASDERLALASSAARLGVWDLDLRTKVGVVNAEYRALYGLPPGDGPLPNGDWLARIHPEDRERMLAASAAAQAGLAPYNEECRIIRADTGEMRWVATRGSLVGGSVASGRMVGICYDVTERRQEQERQMLLAREVDHRAKNVLAVVQSIVKLTRAGDPRSFAQAVEGRVAALARAHTLLSRDRWTGASLAEVVREELLAYGGGGRIRLEGPELWVKPDAVQSLSMVLHELATNAAKYGALSRPGGQVTVGWRLDPGGQLRLDWTERGGPPVTAPPERRGFGSTVITATMRSHLEGEAHMAWTVEGLRCEISAPAERVLSAMGAEEVAAPEASGDAAGDAGTPALQGRRVLVVEDEPLLALEIAATLQELGCEIAGPATSLSEALRLGQAEAGRLDAAVMDVNLRGQASFPIADLMIRHGVAVIYVSGYGTLPEAEAPPGQAPTLLRKPLREGDLAAALRHALARRAVAARLPEAAP